MPLWIVDPMPVLSLRIFAARPVGANSLNGLSGAILGNVSRSCFRRVVLPVPAYPLRMKMLHPLLIKSVIALRADSCSAVSVMVVPLINAVAEKTENC